MNRFLVAALVLTTLAPPAFCGYGVEVAFPNLPIFSEVTGLQEPMDGTDRLFVLEKAGYIRVFQNDPSTSVAGTFLAIEDSVVNSAESGMIGLAFHPDYENNGYFYVMYVSKGALRTVLARFTVSVDPDVADPMSELRLFELPQVTYYHKGGCLAFGPDGYLYVGLGEDAPSSNAQDRTLLKGKVLRIDVDSPSGGLNYGIPPDNPFVGNLQGWREEIWAFGFRNPWRFSFDPPTGRLWLGDVGLDSYEEVDIVKKGRNYGWAKMEGPECYQPPVCDTTGLDIDLPVIAYPHESEYGEAVMGGEVYHGTRTPSLNGWYIYADHAYGQIWAFKYDGVNPSYNKLLYHDTSFRRVVDFCVDKDNELFIANFVTGRIHQLTETPSVVAPTPDAGPLVSAQPNPFSGQTRIQYASPGPASIEIFDVQGRFVRRLADRAVGNGDVVWDGRDRNGKSAASGVYFARLAVGGNPVATRRIVLIR